MTYSKAAPFYSQPYSYLCNIILVRFALNNDSFNLSMRVPFRLIFVSICSLILLSCQPQQQKKPNVIIMIGDGMGPAFITAYRKYLDDHSTPEVEATAFDDMLVGTAKTDLRDHEHHIITDSAASATALATGQKTYYEAIAVDLFDVPLKTTMEIAREQGYQTGVVVLSRVNHATPASFVSHNRNRNNYKDLANQYIDDKINDKPKLDIIFGGGQKHFIRTDRNIVDEFQDLGYQSALSWDEFDNITQKPAIALLADKGLPYEIDSPVKQRLSKITEKALGLLAIDKPFYMLIEGSQIDWCGHNNDIACAMHEMADFEETVKIVKAFVEKTPNTLLVLTSDHSTGGLTVGANYELIYDGPKIKYRWNRDYIQPIKASVKAIARDLFYAQEGWYERWVELTRIELSASEQQALRDIVVGYEVVNPITLSDLTDDHREQLRAAMIQINGIINGRSKTGWTTGGHTGVDVNIYSMGKYSERFAGNLDNTRIGKIVRDILTETK